MPLLAARRQQKPETNRAVESAVNEPPPVDEEPTKDHAGEERRRKGGHVLRAATQTSRNRERARREHEVGAADAGQGRLKASGVAAQAGAERTHTNSKQSKRQKTNNQSRNTTSKGHTPPKRSVKPTRTEPPSKEEAASSTGSSCQPKHKARNNHLQSFARECKRKRGEYRRKNTEPHSPANECQKPKHKRKESKPPKNPNTSSSNRLIVRFQQKSVVAIEIEVIAVPSPTKVGSPPKHPKEGSS
jgi:hypothetical protein